MPSLAGLPLQSQESEGVYVTNGNSQHKAASALFEVLRMPMSRNYPALHWEAKEQLTKSSLERHSFWFESLSLPQSVFSLFILCYSVHSYSMSQKRPDGKGKGSEITLGKKWHYLFINNLCFIDLLAAPLAEIPMSLLQSCRQYLGIVLFSVTRKWTVTAAFLSLTH